MVRKSEKDIKIIKMLFENARMPFTEIARKLKVSEAAIRKKVKDLMKKGVIKKFTIEVNWKKLGFDYHVIVGLDTKPESLLRVIKELEKEKRILRLFTCSGDHMIIFEAVFKNREEFEDFIEKLEKKEDITRVCPAIVIEEFVK